MKRRGAAREEVSWVSPDSEVVSLVTSTDNTSHAVVTTGASKVLPVGNGELAKGGGGNGVGIAVLDSGISPPAAAVPPPPLAASPIESELTH